MKTIKLLLFAIVIATTLLGCNNELDSIQKEYVQVGFSIDNLISVSETPLTHTKARSRVSDTQSDSNINYYIVVSKENEHDNIVSSGYYGIFDDLSNAQVYLEKNCIYNVWATVISSNDRILWENEVVQGGGLSVNQFVSERDITPMPTFADKECLRFVGKTSKKVVEDDTLSIEASNFSYGIRLSIAPPATGQYIITSENPEFHYVVNKSNGFFDNKTIYSYPYNDSSKKECTIVFDWTNDNGVSLSSVSKRVTIDRNSIKLLAIKEEPNNYNIGFDINIDDTEMTEDSVNVKITKPSFAFVDDDGHKSVYTYTYSWAKRNNCPITIALPTGIIGRSDGRNYITVRQAQEMYNSGLVTIGSHTFNHNPNLDQCSDPEFELSQSLADLQSWGFDDKYIFYPNGVINDNVLSLAANYYDYGFLAGGNMARPQYERVNLSITDPLQIKRMSIPCPATVQQIENIKAGIDYAIQNNGFIIFMTHIRTVESDALEDIDNYNEILNYIRNKGFDIEPLGKVLDRFK